jgi:hypothetical protein
MLHVPSPAIGGYTRGGSQRNTLLTFYTMTIFYDSFLKKSLFDWWL